MNYKYELGEVVYFNTTQFIVIGRGVSKWTNNIYYFVSSKQSLLFLEGSIEHIIENELQNNLFSDIEFIGNALEYSNYNVTSFYEEDLHR